MAFEDVATNDLRAHCVSLIQRTDHWHALNTLGLPQKGPRGHIEAIADAICIELIARGESEDDLLLMLRRAYRLKD